MIGRVLASTRAALAEAVHRAVHPDFEVERNRLAGLPRALQAEVRAEVQASETHFRDLVARLEERTIGRVARLEERLAEHTDAIGRDRLDDPHADIALRVTSVQQRARREGPVPDPSTVRWIEECVRPGDVLYDVGAKEGHHALIAAKRGGGVRIVAFEPDIERYAALCRNIANNRCGSELIPMPLALAAMTGLRRPILSFRLDDAVAKLGLPPPNHLRIEVDGSELEVLQGAPQTLGSPALRSLLVRSGPSRTSKLGAVLREHGFEPRSAADSSPPEVGRPADHVVFVRNGSR